MGQVPWTSTHKVQWTLLLVLVDKMHPAECKSLMAIEDKDVEMPRNYSGPILGSVCINTCTVQRYWPVDQINVIVALCSPKS